MAVNIIFAGAAINRPGSYSETSIAATQVEVPTIGTVALIGEADAGIPFSQETGLSAVTYGPDEMNAIIDKYGSGELVDAAFVAIQPSKDPQIKGGAQELLLLKTNASTKASLAMAGGYGTITDKKGGVAGNSISAQVALVSAQAVITINDVANGVSEISQPLGGNVVMTVQCNDVAATAATLTISATTISSAITGGTTQPLNVPVSQFATIAKLVEYINAQPGYAATVASNAMGNIKPSALDQVAGLNIKTVAGQINKDAYEVQQFFAQSSLVTFVPSIYAGLPGVMAKTYLRGGSVGGTSAASILSCLDALLKKPVNFIVPLFSRDATADIADGLTDSSSNYTIDAVHAGLASHCNLASAVKGRKERQGYAGYKDTYANSKEKAQLVNSGRVTLHLQDVDVLTPSGIQTKHPHFGAVVNAGMKASAPIGLANLFKAPSIVGYSHVDFDPETQGEDAIANNLCFFETSPKGTIRYAIDNSTYQSDDNAWYWNRPSVVYAGDIAALSIRINTEIYVGQRNSDVSEESITNNLVGVFDELRTLGVIVADNNTGGKGYKDLKVKIVGSIIYVSVTLALVENFEFILSDIKIQRAG